MYIYLFESKSAAQSAAFMLRGEWDGCNGIVLETVDESALTTVLNLVKSSCCTIGSLSYRITNAHDLIELSASGSDLSGIKLQSLNLSGADLTGINLKNTYFQSINLTSANLTNANLAGVIMDGCQLDKAILNKTDFSNTHIFRTSFYRASFENVNLSGTSLNYSNFIFSSFQLTSFLNTSLAENNFFGAIGSCKSELKKNGWIILLDGTTVLINEDPKYLENILVQISQHFGWKFCRIFGDFMFNAWKPFSIFWICLFCLLLRSNPLSEILALLGDSIKVGVASLFIPLVPEFFNLTSSNSFIKSCNEIINITLSYFVCFSVMMFAVLAPSTNLTTFVNWIFSLEIIIYFCLVLILTDYLLQKSLIRLCKSSTSY